MKAEAVPLQPFLFFCRPCKKILLPIEATTERSQGGKECPEFSGHNSANKTVTRNHIEKPWWKILVFFLLSLKANNCSIDSNQVLNMTVARVMFDYFCIHLFKFSLVSVSFQNKFARFHLGLIV